MLRIKGIKLGIHESEDKLRIKAAKKLNISENDILDLKIYKKSLDARQKGNIFFIYTVDVFVSDEELFNAEKAVYYEYKLPKGETKLKNSPVIIGFGPAGIFAALILSYMGLKPVVLERGKDIDSRKKDVDDIFETGSINLNSNVLFGEGGAGTFSDGKLTSRSKDERSRKVLQEFVDAGAPCDILYTYNPHIGTDLLREVIKTLREKIISFGGTVLFESNVTELIIENNKISGVVVNDSKKIYSDNVILSCGHSARDVFELLKEKNIPMEQKPFAAGVRIEHKQADINRAQFKKDFDCPSLGKAEYKLTASAKDGRGVYTFCMCPGGYVVNASSEEGQININGMSYHKRDGENANSALLVQIYPGDFESDDVLAGVEFQRKIERAAFNAAGKTYCAPVQLLGDFLNNRKSTEFKSVVSTYSPKTSFCDINDIFPEFMCEGLKDGIVKMGKKLKGFDNPEAVLTAAETRSSSPVRILRDSETLQSVGVKGLYPVGEGAGYAGGIVSAAIDGIRAAEAVFKNNLK